MSGPPLIDRTPVPAWADAGPDRAARHVTALDVAIVFLRHRWLILSMALLLALVFLATSLLQTRTYTATATFMPHARRTPAPVTGLAAQLGLVIGSPEGDQSPQFYVDLLQSREILLAVVDTQYQYVSNGEPVSGTLVEILGTRGTTTEFRRRQTAEAVRGLIETSTSPRTGVITLALRAEHPVLAQQIALNLLGEVVRFNSQRRQSQAVAERRFTEQRVNEAAAELRAAEERWQSFLQQNREFRGSLRLSMAQDRLARDVAMRQSVYTGLAQAFEQAKIEEVRDSPVLTIIDPPDVPLLPDSRGTGRKTLMGLVLGLFLGVLLAVVREYFTRTSGGQGDAAREFARLRAEAVSDLIHPVRRLRRRRGVRAAS
jgi:uncharacterized protein involved in exopolysaccharide biosynthesis